ncbi:polyketide synthase [Hydnomerulius pinastri MD-312]|uniref:Pks1 protein n=1 Tax=Hydnomerulius pinastri MD-312 TaxID=994086 RepID=A0A0C9WA19_9AGAM|nr:polyketide synthase [Hydnomerulius pinastri MD-312]
MVEPTPESKRTVIIPVFSGQGSGRASLAQARDQAIRDTDSHLGPLLLSSCFDAFLSELCILSPHELDQSGICSSDFRDPGSLLAPQPRYKRNQIISGTSLFLTQALRYQSHVQSTSRSHSSRNFLETNTDYGVGVLGLSSGIFPACVVAASHNALTYISNAVEVFRLVFWLGFRVLQFTRRLLKDNPVDSTLPWSVVCLGFSQADMQEHIAVFEQQHGPSPSLCITAILDERCITVSGLPDVLQAFSSSISQLCTVHPTTVDGLYHSLLHLPDTRERVLSDVTKRNIRFPDYHDLLCPLRSTISGTLATFSRHEYPSLVHHVVDMVLIRPVNWDVVAKEVAHSVPPDIELQVVNIGPSSGSVRALEKALPDMVLRCADAATALRDDAAASSPKQEPIAIVGMAAHAPGALNTSELWEILEKGISTVSKIPEDRFDRSLHMNLDAVVHTPAMKVETGNFMSDYADFDHKFFKISPREARSMDPQQRVLLHTAYEALENAGYVPDATPSFRRDTFGCYIGAATQDYVENLRTDIDIHYSPGTLKAFLSGRVSYFMQFGGPSVVVDTACSSSMVAIYQACRALMNMDCNSALAGGVNVMSSLDMFIGLERGHFLNTSGQCKAFDATADGYSRGEGCCLFVLKRLSDAIAENDNIIGVIRGVEVNQSGLASSITHPHSPTQAVLLRKLLESSAVHPSRISVVEAHGTGTQAGDSSELASIRSVLAQGRADDNPLHVTSIKANIGHLEAASGAVGLCKLLLMLRHNMIPAQISLKTLNPRIAPLDSDNTVIDTLLGTWEGGSSPRMAIVNNFGAAGSNGALLLEEYIKPNSSATSVSLLFGISAKSAEALKALRSRYIQWLRDAENFKVPLCDIAYTATARRQLYPYRLSVTAEGKEQLVHALEAASPTHVRVGRAGGQVIFVFSGQGSQYIGMGASLYATSPIFKGCVDRCHDYLVSLGYNGILAIIAPQTCQDPLPQEAEFEAYQSAVLALEFALSSLWRHWGLIPTGVIGQSLGEYAAMVTADVLSIETALSIVAKRARLMAQACPFGQTGMLSISLSSSQTQAILDVGSGFPRVTIACMNTESSCVVSGPLDELRKLAAYLSVAHRCKTVVLDVPLGFHSAVMDPILGRLRDHVASLPINAPSIPIASNVLGVVISAGDGSALQPEYFSQHCRQPVRFSQGLQALSQYLGPIEIDAWVEIGPLVVCLPMIKAILAPLSDTLLLASMRKGVRPWNTISNGLSHLYKTNLPLDWQKVFTELSPSTCVDLPSYPFVTEKFWVANKDHAALPAPTSKPSLLAIDHPMLSSWSQYPTPHNGNVAIFDTPIGALSLYIEGHRVSGHALCPASVYLEQALAGAILAHRHMSLDFGRCTPMLQRVQFSRPLVYQPNVNRIVRTHVTIHEDGAGMFSVASRLESSREESVHVQGDIRFSSTRETASTLALELPGIIRRAEVVTSPPSGQSPEIFSTRTTYEVVFPRVVEYSKDYHTVQSLAVSPNGLAGVARIALPAYHSPRALAAQPLFVDTLLHVAGFIANMQGDVCDAYICSDLGSLKILHDLIVNGQAYTVHCANSWISSGNLVSADIFAVQESNPQVVVAHLQGVQFRRVGLTSLNRGLGIAADTTGAQNRKRTNSNAIIPPASPRSVIFARSPSFIHGAHRFCDTEVAGLEIHARESYTSSSRPLSPTTLVSESGTFDDCVSDINEERIRTIMSEVLGISDSREIQNDSDFQSLGLDSLGAIEAQQALKMAFNTPIPHNVFTTCGTFLSLCKFIMGIPADRNVLDALEEVADAPVQRQWQNSDPAVVSFQQPEDNENAPLFLIHDGSGLVSYYERLSPLHRAVRGLRNPRFFTKEPWESIEDMAQAYARAIERHANGALILGGWSFGGVVAFEIARVLTAHGLDVKGVVLLDSPHPPTTVMLSASIIDYVTGREEQKVDSLMGPLIKYQFEGNTQLLRAFVPVKQQTGLPLAFLRSTEGFCPPGVKDIPLWFSERDNPQSTVSPWEALVGRHVKVWDIPGHHFEPFSSTNVMILPYLPPYPG